MGFLDRLLDVPGSVPPTVPPLAGPGRSPLGGRSGSPLFLPRGTGSLSSFAPGQLVKVFGVPRPTGRSPVSPDICYRVKLSPGARGTIETLEFMRELAIEAQEDPGFVQEARAIVRECPARYKRCQANAILQHVHETVPYLNDPMFCEWIQSPGWTYFVDGHGDCDDSSDLIAGFDLAVGLGCRFASYRCDRSRPDEFSHVMCQAGIRDPETGKVVWLGQDSIVPEPKLGWEPPRSAWLGPPNYVVVAEP